MAEEFTRHVFQLFSAPLNFPVPPFIPHVLPPSPVQHSVPPQCPSSLVPFLLCARDTEGEKKRERDRKKDRDRREWQRKRQRERTGGKERRNRVDMVIHVLTQHYKLSHPEWKQECPHVQRETAAKTCGTHHETKPQEWWHAVVTSTVWTTWTLCVCVCVCVTMYVCVCVSMISKCWSVEHPKWRPDDQALFLPQTF